LLVVEVLLHNTLEEEALVVIEHLFQVLVQYQFQFKVTQLLLVQVEHHLQHLVHQEPVEILQLLIHTHQQLVVEEEVTLNQLV
jgi:hypothetical protein